MTTAADLGGGDQGPVVVVVGNLTVDDVVRPDGTTSMATVGGNSVHVASAALVNGARPVVVARRGEDFPAAALRRLAAAGVDVEHLVPVPGPTVRNWVVYEDDGSRHWIYRTPPGRSLEVAPRPDDLPAAVLADAVAVHVAAMPLANAEAVVARVRTVNPSALVVLDTHEDWVGPVRDRLLTLARSVDVFVPSAEELTELTGCDEPADGLAVLAADGLRRAVVKAGGRGAYVLEDGHVWHVPATTGPVDDTTGAGDSFCGALVAALASARSLSDAARAGCATAGVAIAASGSTRLLERADAASAVVAAAAGLEVRDLGPVATEPRSPDTYDIDVMHREILTIPDVVASTVADPTGAVHALAESLVAAGTEHLWLTGCGDSAFAGAAAVLALRRDGGLSARAVHALDLARYETRYLPAGSVVVALSFSGRVGRTTEAAVQARRFGHRVVALTNDPDGPLARASDDVLPVDVPTLGFSPGTSTYVGMLATLLALAAQVAAVRGDPGPAERLAALPAMAETTLTSSLDAARAAAGLMLGHQWVAFLGGGPNEATARFGAAKLFEGPQLVGHPTNLEEWAHEEYFVTRPGDPVVLVAPSGASYDRAGEILDELRFVGARPIVVSDLDPGDGVLHLPLATGAPEHLSPLLACLPLALTGFHLARLSGKRSYNFASEAARVEHYETIHRATVGEPA